MIKNAELENSAYEFEAMPLRHAVPLGLQHVFAMFVGNLTPLLIITSACGLAGGEFADLQVSLLQNAMFVAGIVTLVQLYGLGPVGGKVPIIMGTSSGFLGVFNSVAATMGGGVTAYGAMMGASILGGLFESVLGVFLKPLRKLFPPVVTGTVVLSIGLSLISVNHPSAALTQQELRLGGEPAAGRLRAGGHPLLQALDQWLLQLFLHPRGHHRGLSGSHRHGLRPAHHRRHR